MSLLGLLPANGEIAGGRIIFDGRDLAAMSDKALRAVRGREIGLISQEPMVSLTPGFRVGWQIALAIRTHHGVSRRAARARAIELLQSVQLPEPELVAQRYPHELSGGMAQRVAIARALAGDPKLLIADEPTTALDVTVQAEILELLHELKQTHDMAILLVTHDWGVVADLCDRAVVMYAGEVVEQAPLLPLFHEPLHPYTQALLASNPHHAQDAEVLPVIMGSVPRPGMWPAGCHFHPRCPIATEACETALIPLERPIADRETRCIHHDMLAAGR
jgi:peptide/nickel transport system permease protein